MFRIRTKPDKAIPENEKITGESPHYFIQNIKLKTAAKCFGKMKNITLATSVSSWGSAH